MSYQIELDKKLLKYFLEEEKPLPKEKLKDCFNKDENNTYIKTRENYFHLSYNSLVHLKLINEDGKLNYKYKKIFELEEKKKNLIFSLIVDTVQRYRARLFQALEIQKGIDNLWLAEDEAQRITRREITDEESKDILDDISTVIHDLLDRFLNNSNNKPNTSYQLRTHSTFEKETSMNVLFFKKLLFYILDSGKEFIYNDDIVREYEGMIKSLEWGLSTNRKSNLKKEVIKVFKLLGILENDKAPYKVVEITDPDWKMNVLSKIDAIKDIVKSISRKNEISREDKDVIMKIFNFSN